MKKKDKKRIMQAWECIGLGTKVKVIDNKIDIPPFSLPVKKNDIITIFKPDGMYCSGKNSNGNRIYIAAWTKIETCTKWDIFCNTIKKLKLEVCYNIKILFNIKRK